MKPCFQLDTCRIANTYIHYLIPAFSCLRAYQWMTAWVSWGMGVTDSLLAFLVSEGLFRAPAYNVINWSPPVVPQWLCRNSLHMLRLPGPSCTESWAQPGLVVLPILEGLICFRFNMIFGNGNMQRRATSRVAYIYIGSEKY